MAHGSLVREIDILLQDPKVHQNRKRSADEHGYDLFDFDRWEKDGQGTSRADSSSIPDLTSGTATDTDESYPLSPPPSAEERSNLSLRDEKIHDGDLIFPRPHPDIHTSRYEDQLRVELREDTPTKQRPIAPKQDSNPQLPLSLGSASRGSQPAGKNTTPEKKAPRGKRNSSLKDPEEVSGVRAAGACVACRCAKTKCNEYLPCKKCNKDANVFSSEGPIIDPNELCTRNYLSSIGCAFNTCSELNERPRSKQDSQVSKWHIAFARSGPRVSNLLVSVLPVEHDSKSLSPRYTMYRGSIPSQSQLKNWAESYIDQRGSCDFQCALDLFFRRLLSLGTDSIPSRLRLIIDRVHTFRCMHIIWSSELTGGKIAPDHESIYPICLEVKDIAVNCMKSAETAIHEEIDKIMKKPDLDEGGYEILRLCMWPLILIYRGIAAESFKAAELLQTLTIMYRAAQKGAQKNASPKLQFSQDLKHSFEAVMEKRTDYLQRLAKSVSDDSPRGDRLLQALVAMKGLKDLGLARKPIKSRKTRK